jgi:ATP-dependent Lon protease
MVLNTTDTDFDRTIRDLFPNASVMKPLTLLSKLPGVPQRVWEYFVLKYVDSNSSTDDITHKMDEMLRVARQRIPEPGAHNDSLNRLRTVGEIEIIDAISVDINPHTMESRASSHHFGSHVHIEISDTIIEANERMLFRPVWGRVLYGYNGEDIQVYEFHEIQNTNVRVDEFTLARQSMTTDEWIRLIVRSVGLNDDWLDEEGRWHVVTRLLPLVESRLHMMEPGPKETGKTTTYTNLDARVSMVTGLDVTMAKLIFDGTRRIPGLLARNTDGLVVFDELQNGRDRRNVAELAGQLKQVMESGRIERLNFQAETDASIVFVGNTLARGDQIQQLMPPPFREAAFLSRIAGLIDGHQMPTIERSDISLAQGVGLTCDYFSEVIRQLRQQVTPNEILERVQVIGGSTRDERAIRRMLSAYLKLLHPDGNVSTSELITLAQRALNLRIPIIDAAARSEGVIPRRIQISVDGSEL